MKRLISLVIIFLLSFTICAKAEPMEIASWAKSNYEFMSSIGVIPESTIDQGFKSDILRSQFADLLYNTYNECKGEILKISGSPPFNDTISPSAAALFSLGIINGDGEGNFNPNKPITRQESAKMLYFFYNSINGETLRTDLSDSLFYNDHEQIDKWARTYVDAVSYVGIMAGCGDGNFCPKSFMSVEQAIVLAHRTMISDGTPTRIGEDSIEGAPQIKEGPTATVSWENLPDYPSYRVKITEWRNTKHGEEMGYVDPVIYTISGAKQITFNTKPVRRYIVVITAGSHKKTTEVKTSSLKTWQENLAEIEAIGIPLSGEEALPLMETVTVNVWTIKNGEKVPSTMPLTVHKAIAEKVVLIFDEIFVGDEKFPINSLGGYSWRGGKSEHNQGTAIDINPVQNYCLYTDGTIVGDFYKPYENPYSITPFGNVVEAFEKYGFNWGGDTWNGNRDYMHFSYCGT